MNHQRAAADPAPLQRGRTDAALLLRLYSRATSAAADDPGGAAWRRLRQRLDQGTPRQPSWSARGLLFGGALTALLGLLGPFQLLSRHPDDGAAVDSTNAPAHAQPLASGLGGTSGAAAAGEDRGAGGMEGATGARGAGGP